MMQLRNIKADDEVRESVLYDTGGARKGEGKHDLKTGSTMGGDLR